MGVAEGGDRVPDPPNRGVDLCQRHVVRASSRERAEAVCADVALLGYQVSAKLAQGSSDWLVVAFRWVTREQLGPVYDQMTGVADRFGGTWEESRIAAVR